MKTLHQMLQGEYKTEIATHQGQAGHWLLKGSIGLYSQSKVMKGVEVLEQIGLMQKEIERLQDAQRGLIQLVEGEPFNTSVKISPELQRQIDLVRAK